MPCPYWNYCVSGYSEPPLRTSTRPHVVTPTVALYIGHVWPCNYACQQAHIAENSSVADERFALSPTDLEAIDALNDAHPYMIIYSFGLAGFGPIQLWPIAI